MNKVVLIGRITKDIELKKSQENKYYTRFNLAVPRPMTKDETDFINCVAFEKTAELMEKYLHKGDRIAIEGKIRVGKYSTKEGKKRTQIDIFVENIQFLGEKKKRLQLMKKMTILLNKLEREKLSLFLFLQIPTIRNENYN